MCSQTRAYSAPFLLFIALMAAGDLLGWPRHWVYASQTLLCGGLLLFHFRQYSLRFRPCWLWTIPVAAAVFAIWVSPQALLGFPRRESGFDPNLFASHPLLYWLNLSLRFARLVIVVPLLEEIFWRGFLIRWLITEDFTKVPPGRFTPVSFFGVVACFGLAHWGPQLAPGQDFLPALITSALYNLVLYRSRNLGDCVLAHAATNLLLGLYIMATRQWGFW